MAEIKIEKKTVVWPWILLGLIVLALLIYFLFFRNSDENTVAENTTSTVVTDQNAAAGDNSNSAVGMYSAFINSDTAKMGEDHEYTSTALSRLIQATQSVADEQGYDIKADLDQANNYADKITQDPQALTHANSIKSAADIIARALQNLQRAKFPQLNAEAEQVKSAANNIDLNSETLNQKQQIKSFFNDASDLLQKMDS
jgi:hypothetical protein